MESIIFVNSYKIIEGKNYVLFFEKSFSSEDYHEDACFHKPCLYKDTRVASVVVRFFSLHPFNYLLGYIYFILAFFLPSGQSVYNGPVTVIYYTFWRLASLSFERRWEFFKPKEILPAALFN